MQMKKKFFANYSHLKNIKNYSEYEQKDCNATNDNILNLRENEDDDEINNLQQINSNIKNNNDKGIISEENNENNTIPPKSNISNNESTATDRQTKDKLIKGCLNDIVMLLGNNKYKFNEKYESKIRIIPDIITNSKNNFYSIIIGVYEYNIINTIISFPFYILYVNKKTKEKKILINHNNINRIFKLSINNNIEEVEEGMNIKNNKGFELEKDYRDEINKIINTQNFQQENIIVLCCFRTKIKNRKIKYDNCYDYDIWFLKMNAKISIIIMFAL